jgi:hypothetical protein
MGTRERVKALRVLLDTGIDERGIHKQDNANLEVIKCRLKKRKANSSCCEMMRVKSRTSGHQKVAAANPRPVHNLPIRVSRDGNYSLRPRRAYLYHCAQGLAVHCGDNAGM